MKIIGRVMIEVLNFIKPYKLPSTKEERIVHIKKFVRDMTTNKRLKELRKEVKSLALKFPLP
jgi:hypothetical protein